MGVQPRSKELKQTKGKQKVAVKVDYYLLIQPKRNMEKKKNEIYMQ